ncbi:MAG: plasmid replication protein [Paenisporosarcina sp.]|nr:plasmid replication protein [Paenisporosarcina sp.]
MTTQKSVLKHADNSISVRFGFLGLGMGGSSIAAACAETNTNTTNDRYPYASLLINTNKMDLDKIETKNPNTKKLIIADGQGAARDIATGEKMFVQDLDVITKEFKQRFEGSDFVWIVAGLGGGTGTGSVLQAIKMAMTSGFEERFGLILTLPRTSEGQKIISNALQRLMKINQAMSGLGSIILVDNEKLFSHFAQKNPNAPVAEYLTFSNQFVADTLHEMNVVTSSFKPSSEFHFDSSEFRKLIKTPGVLHFARFSKKANEIDSAQSISHVGSLKEQIENGVLSDGYDLNNTKRLAVSVLANTNTATRLFNFKFTQELEQVVNSVAPFADEKPIAFYKHDNKETSDVFFYAVFAGLQLPSRVAELVQTNTNLLEQQKQQQSNNTDIFAGFTLDDEPIENKTKSFDDLFGDKDESNEKVSSKEAILQALFDK